jgi:hypothetical protein
MYQLFAITDTSTDHPYKIRVQVPTTIFEPLAAAIEIHGNKQDVYESYRLHAMPKYDADKRAVSLARKDRKGLEGRIEKLLRKMERA